MWPRSMAESEGRVAPSPEVSMIIDATVEKVEGYPTIMGYGVIGAPALVVDEKVVVSGRVPTSAQIREMRSPQPT